MKYTRPIALLLVVGGIVSSPAVAEQSSSSNIDKQLSISVTVDPTCTVAKLPGVQKPEEAINLACRNFREGQPEPIVFETQPRDGHAVAWIRF